MQSNCGCYTPSFGRWSTGASSTWCGEKEVGENEINNFKWHNQKLPSHLTNVTFYAYGNLLHFRSFPKSNVATYWHKKVRNSNSLWLIPDLKKFLFERNIAKKIASSAKSNKTWVCFQAMRNKVNTAIKKAKVSYNNLFFKSNHVNIKHKWKKINTIFSWTLQPIQIHNLKIGDTCTICTTADEISNGLNQHFCMFFLCHMSSPKKSD